MLRIIYRVQIFCLLLSLIIIIYDFLSPIDFLNRVLICVFSLSVPYIFEYLLAFKPLLFILYNRLGLFNVGFDGLVLFRIKNHFYLDLFGWGFVEGYFFSRSLAFFFEILTYLIGYD